MKKARKSGEFSMVAIAIGLAVVGKWLQAQHNLPDRWLGDEGFFPVWGLLQFVSIAASICAVMVFLATKRWVSAVSMIVLAVATIAFVSPTSWRYRWNEERGTYHAAMRNHEAYGHQFQQECDGRQLTFWRWRMWGLDNAEGIIYDPEDRLAAGLESDYTMFYKQTHGALFRVVRIEPRWYYVNFS